MRCNGGHHVIEPAVCLPKRSRNRLSMKVAFCTESYFASRDLMLRKVRAGNEIP